MAQAMSVAAAQTFERKSDAHANLLRQVAQERGCSCQPYVDWFTYNRWAAQGYQVQKGERGVRLTTWITLTKETDQGETVVTGKRPKGTTVFCRCQVKPREG